MELEPEPSRSAAEGSPRSERRHVALHHGDAAGRERMATPLETRRNVAAKSRICKHWPQARHLQFAWLAWRWFLAVCFIRGFDRHVRRNPRPVAN